MRLTSWNVNGIRALHSRGDLDWAFASDHDVFCLQEVKADPAGLPAALRAPDGWRVVFNAGDKKGYSGVATYVREEHDLVVVAEGLGEERFDREGRVIATDHGAFLLYNIYFPNGRQGPERVQFKIDFYERLLDVVTAHREDGREVVICGDFNTALTDNDVWAPKEWEGVSTCLPDERAVFQKLLDSGFIDTFRAEAGDRAGQFSYWDYLSEARADNRGIRIDYFLISEGLEDYLADAWISSQIMGSDHCPVGLELDV